jgi:hypothetical protein
MPIHDLMMGTSLAMNVRQPSLAARKRFAVGTWAIPKTGTYKGDLGMVVNDTYNTRGHPGDIDRNSQCRMVFIPRLNNKPLESLHFRNKQKTKFKEPRPSAQLVKVHSAETIIKHYNYRRVRVECTVFGCKSPTCAHPGRRYHLRGATLLPISGLAIVTQNYYNLDLAESMPDNIWSIFREVLGGRNSEDVPGVFKFKPELVPIPSSWSFSAGEEVVTWSVPGLVDGTVGTIFETARRDCIIEVGNPVLHRVCCLYRRLRKHYELGDAIRVLQNCGSIEAGTDGLVCKVGTDYVEIAFDIRDDRTYPVHRNSITKVASETRVSYKDLRSAQLPSPPKIQQHETYTGGVPFKYLPVYVIARHSLRLQPGRILDVNHPQADDPPSLQVSGLKVLVEIFSAASPVWFDWDSLRRVSNKRFIQDDGLDPDALSVRSFAKDPHNYFSFRPTYIPKYSNQEKRFLNLPVFYQSPIPQPGMTFAAAMNQSKLLFPDVGGSTPRWQPSEVQHSATPAWDPGSRTPAPVSSLPDSPGGASASHTPLPAPSGADSPILGFSPRWASASYSANPFTEREASISPDDWDLFRSQITPQVAPSHWILDARIRDGLKGMYLGIAIIGDALDKNREVQLLYHNGSTHIREVSRNKNSVQLGSEIPVTQIPTDYCSNALGEPETSSNLFIVCRGLHIGQLGRSVKRERIYDSIQKEWVSFYLLRVVEVTPPGHGSRNKSYDETFLDSSIRVLGCDLAVVEVTNAQRKKYNGEMIRYR